MRWPGAFNVLTFNFLTIGFILSISSTEVKTISAIRAAMHSLTIKSEFDAPERRVIFHIAMNLPSPPEGLRWRLDLYSPEGALIKRFEGGELPPAMLVWSVPDELSGGVIYQLILSFMGVDLSSTPRAIFTPTSKLTSKLPKFRLQAQPRELSDETSTLLIITPVGTAYPSIRPELCVMNGEGMEVWKRKLDGGPELVRWEGNDTRGKSVSPGVYICAVKGADMILSNFVVLTVRPFQENNSFFSSSIAFRPGSAEFTPEGKKRIEGVLSFIRAHPGVAVEFKVGLSPGDPIRGMELAYRRVKKVAEYLNRSSPGLMRITGLIRRSDEIRVDLVPSQGGNFFPSPELPLERNPNSP
ncbi:TPA: hypothetical protein EYP37_01780 [Candidatus Poribacteria bacterium]|nr:hypothetical protein [Candidatus Poribacteria bacterium]